MCARPKWEHLLPLQPVLPGLPSVYSSPSCSFLVLSIKCVDSGSGLGGGGLWAPPEGKHFLCFLGAPGQTGFFETDLRGSLMISYITKQSYDFPGKEGQLW